MKLRMVLTSYIILFISVIIVIGNETDMYSYAYAAEAGMRTMDVVMKTVREKVNSCNAYVISDILRLSRDSSAYYISARITYNGSIYSGQDILKKLNNDSDIICAETDYDMYSDAAGPLAKEDKNMYLQWYLAAIGAEDAWEMTDNVPGEGTVVAVIDTGVDYTHPELKNNMWINEAEANGIIGVDDDNNGVTDDIYGADFAAELTDNNSKPGIGIDGISNRLVPDPDGHGTHIAGVIAMARDNGGGRGIAYGSRIMSVKAGGADGSFKVSAVIAGLDYAVKMGADVINMSFGTYTESEVLRSMIEDASDRCVMVAAAGNNGYPTTDYKDGCTYDVYPAAFPQVIGVMAVDSSLSLVSWSNYDYTPYTASEYEIAAPGYRIYSTVPNKKYSYMSGTSMATPMVSAAAAILYSKYRTTKVDDIAGRITAQLVEGTAHTTKYIDSTGVEHIYPLLNIYDSLTAEPHIKMNIGSFTHSEASEGYFDDTIAVEKGRSVNISCGFRLSNLWAGVKDVNITRIIKDTSAVNKCNDVTIAMMKPRSFVSVNCNDEEAASFTYNADTTGTYKIPVTYIVSAASIDGSECSRIICEAYDSITIQVNEAVDNIDTNDSNYSNQTSPNKEGAKKPGAVKGLSAKRKKVNKVRKNVISWKPAANAGKYELYYSYKKKGKYHKLVLTKKLRYTHVLRKKKNCYYKIRAYSNSNGNVLYGKYSKILKVKY